RAPTSRRGMADQSPTRCTVSCPHTDPAGRIASLRPQECVQNPSPSCIDAARYLERESNDEIWQTGLPPAGRRSQTPLGLHANRNGQGAKKGRVGRGSERL